MKVKMMARKISLVKAVSILALLWLALLLTACSDASGSTTIPAFDVQKNAGRTPVPTALLSQARQEWVRLLDQAKEKWLAKNVTNYDLKVSFENTTWSPIRTYTVVVRNGVVVQKANDITRTDNVCCERATPPATLVDFNGDSYTVAGLFQWAYEAVAGLTVEDVNFQILFDGTYGFPQLISTSSFRYTDTQKIWRVEGFNEIKS